MIKISKKSKFYDVEGKDYKDVDVDGVLTRVTIINEEEDYYLCEKLIRVKQYRPRALGVVRNSDGYIRVSDSVFDLPEDQLKQLVILVQQDGYITAESYPNIDERFEKWR